MIGTKWVVFGVALAIIMALEVLVFLLTLVLVLARGGGGQARWLWKGFFFLGLLTALAGVGIWLSAPFFGVSLGFSPSVLYVFSLLVALTGLVGTLSFSAPWRFLSLAFVLVGGLLLIRTISQVWRA